MRGWLTKAARRRLAVAVAALYAVCVIAPPLALAFAGAAGAAHCLTDNNHGARHVVAQGDARSHGKQPHDRQSQGKMYVHADASAAVNGEAGDRGWHAGTCCGLFCIAAVTGDPAVEIGELVHAAIVFPALAENFDGCRPDRIKRPPRPTVTSH